MEQPLRKSGRPPSWIRRRRPRLETEPSEEARIQEDIAATPAKAPRPRSAIQLPKGHVAPVDQLIDRKPMFYSAAFHRRAGFPASHLLRLLPANGAGARTLAHLIFVAQDRKGYRPSVVKVAIVRPGFLCIFWF